MLNVFNGPPVSFNRDGGPSLAYSVRGVTAPVVTSRYSIVEIRSQGRPFYVTQVLCEGLEYVHVKKLTATTMTGGGTEQAGSAVNDFGSVAVTGKTYFGSDAAAPADPDAWIGFQAAGAASMERTFACPLFAAANEIISFKVSQLNTALALSVFWVELVQD